MAKWRTANCAAEWLGSICQVEVAADVGSESAAASVAAEIARGRKWPIILLLCTAIWNCSSVLYRKIFTRRLPRISRQANPPRFLRVWPRYARTGACGARELSDLDALAVPVRCS